MTNVEFIGYVLAAGIASFATLLALFEIRSGNFLFLKGVEAGSGKASIVLIFVERISSAIALKLARFKRFRRLVDLCGGARELDLNLWRAGLDRRFDSHSLVVLRLISALSMLPISIIILGTGSFGAMLSVVVGWSVPRIWIQIRERKRSQSIDMALPAMLDQLSLAVCAGMDFMQAVGRVVEGSREGPLKSEMKRFISSVGMGMTRAAALKELSKRSDVRSLTSIAALLIQADRLGTSVGPVLKVSADRLRDDRLSRAEKRGAAAAQKALIPLVFCIMPATFIVIFGPLVARFVTGGLESLF